MKFESRDQCYGLSFRNEILCVEEHYGQGKFDAGYMLLAEARYFLVRGLECESEQYRIQAEKDAEFERQIDTSQEFLKGLQK